MFKLGHIIVEVPSSLHLGKPEDETLEKLTHLMIPASHRMGNSENQTPICVAR